jgi:hypothetical protein
MEEHRSIRIITGTAAIWIRSRTKTLLLLGIFQMVVRSQFNNWSQSTIALWKVFKETLTSIILSPTTRPSCKVFYPLKIYITVPMELEEVDHLLSAGLKGTTSQIYLIICRWLFQTTNIVVECSLETRSKKWTLLKRTI